jgi:hypothetical protein
MGNK